MGGCFANEERPTFGIEVRAQLANTRRRNSLLVLQTLHSHLAGLVECICSPGAHESGEVRYTPQTCQKQSDLRRLDYEEGCATSHSQAEPAALCTGSLSRLSTA